MKTTVLIIEGVTQITLTPEDPFEKNLISMIDHKHLLEARASKDVTYAERRDTFFRKDEYETSLVIVVRPTQTLIPEMQF